MIKINQAGYYTILKSEQGGSMPACINNQFKDFANRDYTQSQSRPDSHRDRIGINKGGYYPPIVSAKGKVLIYHGIFIQGFEFKIHDGGFSLIVNQNSFQYFKIGSYYPYFISSGFNI